MQPRPNTMNSRPAASHPRPGFSSRFILRITLLVLGVPAILGGKNLPAQSLNPQTTTSAQQQNAPPGQARAASPQDVRAPEPLAAPTSVSPANRPPDQARVSWDSGRLEIVAFNSSLNQILHQVAAVTGAKLEGRIQDQRIFGSYGPGPGCDVLSKLLAGSDYNVAIMGSRDADAPLEILLSARSPAPPQSLASQQNHTSSTDDDRDREPVPSAGSPPPQADQNPFSNGAPIHDPQAFMQEILDRQQKIDQQQQQKQQQDQQQNNWPN